MRLFDFISCISSLMHASLQSCMHLFCVQMGFHTPAALNICASFRRFCVHDFKKHISGKSVDLFCRFSWIKLLKCNCMKCQFCFSCFRACQSSAQYLLYYIILYYIYSIHAHTTSTRFIIRSYYFVIVLFVKWAAAIIVDIRML